MSWQQTHRATRESSAASESTGIRTPAQSSQSKGDCHGLQRRLSSAPKALQKGTTARARARAERSMRLKPANLTHKNAPLNTKATNSLRMIGLQVILWPLMVSSTLRTLQVGAMLGKETAFWNTILPFMKGCPLYIHAQACELTSAREQAPPSFADRA